MITLYRKENDPKGAEIQSALENLVVAHEVQIVSDASSVTPPVEALPAVVESGRVISGRNQLAAYMKELSAWMQEWRKYQVDACYVDDDSDEC